MSAMELHGSSEERRMTSWIINLFLQRGFSFALDSSIELAQQELVDYFVSQGMAGDAGEIARQIESAATANAGLIRRLENADEIVYRARKRDLLPFSPQVEPMRKLKAPAKPSAAPALEGAAPPEPAPPPEAEEPVLESAHLPKPLEETPVTQQYQLAVLLALRRVGGSAKAADVVDMIPELMPLPEEHQGTYARGPKGESKEPKYVKFVHSARRFLLQQGQLDSPRRGVWAITPQGIERLKEAGLIE